MRHTMRRPHDGTVWMLVRFAAWTVLLLLAMVSVYRWSRILTGRMPIRSFRADQIEGADWYIGAMRAHANCVENLPVFGEIVLGLYVGNVASAFVNALAVAVLVARIMQSLVHICFVATQSPRVNVLPMYASARRFFARLASGSF